MNLNGSATFADFTHHSSYSIDRHIRFNEEHEKAVVLKEGLQSNDNNETDYNANIPYEEEEMNEVNAGPRRNNEDMKRKQEDFIRKIQHLVKNGLSSQEDEQSSHYNLDEIISELKSTEGEDSENTDIYEERTEVQEEKETSEEIIYSPSSKMLAKLFRECNISKTTMTKLLKLLHDEKFNIKEVPKTVYSLMRAENEFLKKLKLYKKKTEYGSFFFFDIVEVWQEILLNEELCNAMHFDYQKSNVIKHPRNTQG